MLAQILSVIIFLVMLILIVSETAERHIIALASAFFTLVLVFGAGMKSMENAWNALNINSLFSPGFWYTGTKSLESRGGINWETILFIFGMMVMVEGMAHAGFFRWLCMYIAKMVRYRALPIFFTFMILSFILAMFIDSITVILFLAQITIELAVLLKFNPVPFILSEIFSANLGGASTMCGDPPNIIIGTSLGYSFYDFISNTGVIAAICFLFILGYFYLIFHKHLNNELKNVNISDLPSPQSMITNQCEFVTSCIIFFSTIVLLITHSATGLSVSTIGILVTLTTLVSQRKNAATILKKVDYKTILFFVGLFIVISGLEQTGVLEIVAGFIEKASGNNLMIMLAIILWLSAITSAVVDNIPFAAAMIPVIKSLSTSYGLDLSVLSWALALGTDLGGNATPIGASANVVGLSISDKAGHRIKWGTYLKPMLPATIIVVFISTISIFVRYL